MFKALKIPREQRSFAARGAQTVAEASAADRRDTPTKGASPEPGKAGVNLDQMGRYGNLKQNMTAHRNVMDH